MTPLSRLSNVFLTSVALLSACLAEKFAVRNVVQERKLSLEPIEQYHFLPPVQTSHGDPQDELELLDICLVASVDGKFHALNRSSGQVLWSMGATAATEHPAAVGPLIRTQHADPDPVHDDGDSKELYIIEPQSGDIYVLPRQNEPLQRLPFSMAQLVDMSPFSFSGDDENRVFVGKKATSLLVLELETGRLKGTVDPSSECPWDPFGDLSSDESMEDVDLDELDGTKPPKVKRPSTEILIGRTDYHVSIHTRPRNPSEPRPPVQNLTFSTYGPNNQDLLVQSTYRRTPDDTYIQPTATGDIMSFRTSTEGSPSLPLWGVTFKSPVVAVFDVLQAPNRPSPMALLQPQPRLQDFIPNFASDSNLDDGVTFVGLIPENRALFALSPSRYPLAIFAQPNHYFAGRRRLTIDAPPGYQPDGEENERDLPLSVDDVTRLLKERARCTNGNWDRSCVVGTRPVAVAGQSRLSRLLPDRPAEHHTTTMNGGPVQFSSGAAGVRNGSQVMIENERIDSRLGGQARTYGGSIMAFAIFLVGLWYITRKTRMARERQEVTDVPAPAELQQEAERPAERPVQVVDFADAKPLPALPESLPPIDSVSASSYKSDDFVMVPASPNPPSPEPPTSTIDISVDAVEDAEGEDDSGHEGENAVTQGRKRGTRRRKRGKKNKGNAVANDDTPAAETAEGADERNEDAVPPTPAPIFTLSPPVQGSPPSQQLVVSDEVLGYGSSGTVVYRGSLQGRAVAVKRLLQDFVTLASREVMILQESDDHPNVIRYYYQESQANFLYIALELCPASLADVIEHPDLHRELSNAFEPKRALQQIASGLRHLHALKIIHRDIKPQNILISAAKRGAGAMAGHRMLISDFGLCKRLEVDQTSFLPTAHGAGAAGTVGWRAPEILRGEVNLDDPPTDDSTQSSRGSSVGTATAETGRKLTRLTKSVDIFALGCLFYYILTNGSHPYGDRYEREANILKDTKSLTALESFGEEGLEAIDLITFMLDPDPSKRPDTTTCLIHPFFWNPARRLAFLQDASDRFEIMCRDPRDADLIELEKGAHFVVGNDWQSRLDKVFLDNLGKFRKYDGKSVQDLMRALRNKKHHYQDLPDNVKRHLGPLPDGFLSYFTRRFPLLFMHVHSVVSRTNLRQESMFKSYFELSE